MQGISIKHLSDLTQQNKCLRHQLYTLAKYMVGNSDLDGDVCLPQTKAEICPYRTPPYDDKDERVCISCVIRVLCAPMATDGASYE